MIQAMIFRDVRDDNIVEMETTEVNEENRIVVTICDPEDSYYGNWIALRYREALALRDWLTEQLNNFSEDDPPPKRKPEKKTPPALPFNNNTDLEGDRPIVAIGTRIPDTIFIDAQLTLRELTNENKREFTRPIKDYWKKWLYNILNTANGGVREYRTWKECSADFTGWLRSQKFDTLKD